MWLTFRYDIGKLPGKFDTCTKVVCTFMCKNNAWIKSMCQVIYISYERRSKSSLGVLTTASKRVIRRMRTALKTSLECKELRRLLGEKNIYIYFRSCNSNSHRISIPGSVTLLQD